MRYPLIKVADCTAESFIVAGSTALVVTIWGHSWSYLTNHSWGYAASSEFAKRCILAFTIERCVFAIVKILLKPTLSEDHVVARCTMVSALSISLTVALVADYLVPEEAFKFIAAAVAAYAIPRLYTVYRQEQKRNQPLLISSE